jgi:hypothetical protein
MFYIHLKTLIFEQSVSQNNETILNEHMFFMFVILLHTVGNFHLIFSHF